MGQRDVLHVLLQLVRFLCRGPPAPDEQMERIIESFFPNNISN